MFINILKISVEMLNWNVGGKEYVSKYGKVGVIRG